MSEPRKLYDPSVYDAILKDRQYTLIMTDGLKHPSHLQHGRAVLPMGNMTPIDLSMESELLPHTQIKAQNFLNLNPRQMVPPNLSAVNCIKYEPKIVEVPVLRKDCLTEIELRIVLLSFVLPFYREDVMSENSQRYDYQRAYLTLYGSIDKGMTETIANSGTEYADTRFAFVVCRNRTEFTKECQRIIPHFDKITQYLSVHNVAEKQELLVLTCVLAQTIGKQVYDDNVEKWFQNRSRAAAAVLGGAALEEIHGVKPAVEALNGGNKALSHLFEFRKMIVDRMFGYAKEKNQLGVVFDMVLAMIAGTDITHVFNIDLYLIKCMPELMNIQCLRPYDDQLVRMYAFWKKHAAYFPYVRFFVEPKECSDINRATLMPLIIASHAVATYHSESFKNYKGANTNSKLYIETTALISKYIQHRNESAGIALGVSRRAVMTDVERAYLVSQSLEDEEAGSAVALARNLQAGGLP